MACSFAGAANDVKAENCYSLAFAAALIRPNDAPVRQTPWLELACVTVDSARQKAGMQRVRIGLTGLASVFLAVLLAAVFTGRAHQESPVAANSGAPAGPR